MTIDAQVEILATLIEEARPAGDYPMTAQFFAREIIATRDEERDALNRIPMHSQCNTRHPIFSPCPGTKRIWTVGD